MSPSLETGEFTVVNSSTNTNTHPRPPTNTTNISSRFGQPSLSGNAGTGRKRLLSGYVWREGFFFIVCVVKGYNGVN